MSLAEAAAALDRVLQHSNDPSSSKYPPQLPPPPPSTLPIPKVASVSSGGNSRNSYQTPDGMEKSYPRARTINPCDGFRMPDNSLAVKGDIPADFCGRRYSNGRFQIAFSDSESKAYSNSTTSIRQSDFLSDFCKRPTKKDIFSSIPTFPFRDMVSRPYIRNCEFYQEKEYRYRTLHPTHRDDVKNYNDCFFKKERCETEWDSPKGENFRCDWPVSSRSLTKFRNERPFSDCCPLPDGNWQTRCALLSRTSNKPLSTGNERGPLLRIMGPPSKFAGHPRSRSTSSLRSRFTRNEIFSSNINSASVVPITHSEMKTSAIATSTLAKTSVNSMTLKKVDMARPRIIKNANKLGSRDTFVGNGNCSSGDRRRSKSLSVSACQSEPVEYINQLSEPVKSNSHTPSTVPGKCGFPEECSIKSLGREDSHVNALDDRGPASKSIEKPRLMNSSKDVNGDRGNNGPHSKKVSSKLSSLNFALGTSSGLAVLHPISYRTEPNVGSRPLLNHEPRTNEEQISKIEKNSKHDEGINYTKDVTEVKGGDLKVATFESFQEGGVPPVLGKDEKDENLLDFYVDCLEAEKILSDPHNPSSYRDSKSQIVSSALDCRSVILNVSKTWNSTLKSNEALCTDISFNGNIEIEHPDVILNDRCKDWFGCDDNANYFDDSNSAEAVKLCLHPQEKQQLNGRTFDSLSVLDNDGEKARILEERGSNFDLIFHNGGTNGAKVEVTPSVGKLDFPSALDLLCSAKNRSRYKKEFCNSGNIDCARCASTSEKDKTLIDSQIISSSPNMSEFLMNAEKNGLVASSPKRSRHKIKFAETSCGENWDRLGSNSSNTEGFKIQNVGQTSGGICDEEVMSCYPSASTANNARIYSTDYVSESKSCLLGSTLSSISHRQEMIREMISVEEGASLLKSKSSSNCEIYSHQLHVAKVESESGCTNEILLAKSRENNLEPLIVSSLLVPRNGRLPQLEECDHESSSEGSDGDQNADKDHEQPAVPNIQSSAPTKIVPTEVGVSNSLAEEAVDENANSEIEKSLDTGVTDEFFSRGTNSSQVQIFELDRHEDSSKDSKESEDFHPLDPSKYKTELCRAYQIRGSCRYGTRCNYAHGLDQLKVSFHHGKYKTRNCQAYHETGYCRYGARCSFIHDLEEGILKCSIANKEILEALHHWPEDDSASSATVTWKVFNKRRGRACLDDTLIEFTAIPSLKPADLGPDCDMNNGEANHLGASKVYTLEPNRYSVKQFHRPFRRNTARFESMDDVPSLKRKTNGNGITLCSGPQSEASLIEVKKSSTDHTSERNKSNLVKCKDSPGVEKRQSMIRNSVKDLMTLIKAVEPRYSGNAPNSYSTRNLNFALPSVVSSRRSSKVDVTFGENFLGDGSIHASVSFRKEEHPRQTYLHKHGDDFGRGGPKYSRDCSRDSEFSESRPVLAKKRKCFSFHYKGFCLYGPDCQFLHDD